MTQKIAKTVQKLTKKREKSENKKIESQSEYEKSSNSGEHESELKSTENCSKMEINERKVQKPTKKDDENNVRKFDKNDADKNKTLFLTNLSVSITESDLKSFFQKFGRVVYVRVVRDTETEKPKGSAFLKFRSQFPLFLIFSYFKRLLKFIGF